MARALILGATGLLIEAFYRRVRLGGAPPPRGPLVVVANHTHQLIDVVLALRTIGRPSIALAKAPLFHTPPLSWLVRGIGALPVHRARDGARDEAARKETKESLDTATDVVAAGGSLLLFPEGVSHEEPGIWHAHSGAARIALAAAARAKGAGVDVEPLRIVPLGLLYRQKRRPRSEAATFVGPPIRWDDLLATWREDEAAAVTALTARIEGALRDVTLHLEEWEDLPLIEAATAVADLYGVDDAVRERRALVSLGEGIVRLRAHAPAELAALRGRLDDHARRLRRLGSRPDDRHHVVARGALRLLLRFVAAPFAAIAGILARRRWLIEQAVGAVGDAVIWARLLLSGRLAARVRQERQALLADIDELFRAARALPPAPATLPAT